MTPTARLAEVLTPKGGEALDPDGDYPIAGVLGFGRGLLFRATIKGSETKYMSFARLSAGDVVYSKVKAFEGAVTVVPPEGEGRYVSPEFPVFALDEAVDPAFLRHFLASDVFLAELRTTSSGIGARRERVHPADFLGMRVPLPGIEEQRSIAAHLDRLSLVAKTHNTARPHREALTRAARNSLVQEAGGRRCALVDLLTLRSGEPVVDGARYRVTGVYSFGRGLLSRGVISGSDTKYKTLTAVRSGDVVYSKLGAFENAVAVVDKRFDGSFVSPEFPVFQPTDDLHPDFLRAALTTTSFAEELASASTGVGARQKRVSPGAFLALEMLVPEPRTQERVVEVLRLASRFEHLAQAGQTLAEALAPAARNEIFSAMR